VTFSGHVAITGLTLQLTRDPGILVGVNMALHPILDAIPHAEWSTFRDSRFKAVAITVFDFVIAGLYIWQLFIHLDRPAWLILLSVLSGIWMDVIHPIAARYWHRLHDFHVFTHSWPLWPDKSIDWSKTVTGKTPLWVKLVFQNLLVVVPYWFLTR